MKPLKFCRIQSLAFAFGVVALGLITFSSKAHAARIPIPIHTHPEYFPIGSIPTELEPVANSVLPAGLKGTSFGYYCSRFGILWSNVWTWDCRLGVLTGSDIYALPKELEEKYPKSMAKRGVWNRFGILILLAAVVGLIIVGGRKSKDSEEAQNSDQSLESSESGNKSEPSQTNMASNVTSHNSSS